MTTQRQIEANRRNAQKSTGPRTRGGAMVSSRNAIRHGLTTPPDSNDVAKWLSVILGVAKLPTPAEIEGDPRLQVALRLAISEARVAHRREALNRREADAQSKRLADEADPRTSWEKAAEVAAHLSSQGVLDTFTEEVQQNSLTNRYMREAEGSLRRARKAWILAERNHLVAFINKDGDLTTVAAG